MALENSTYRQVLANYYKSYVLAWVSPLLFFLVFVLTMNMQYSTWLLLLAGLLVFPFSLYLANRTSQVGWASDAQVLVLAYIPWGLGLILVAWAIGTISGDA